MLQRQSCKNAVNEETFDKLYTKTIRRTQQLKNASYHVVEKRSCEISDEDCQCAYEFGLESKVPKDAFYGGRTHLRTTLSEEDIQNGKEILYYDVTSEYPFVNSRKEYRSVIQIFLKHQLPQTNEGWRKHGFFWCSVVLYHSTARLIYPLLPLRRQGALMFPLCYKCCVEKHEDFCMQRKRARALTGTWTTIEIDKAVALGYKLLEVKEVCHFKKRSDRLFSDFIDALYKGKLEASGFPNGATTSEEKLKC